MLVTVHGEELVSEQKGVSSICTIQCGFEAGMQRKLKVLKSIQVPKNRIYRYIRSRSEVRHLGLTQTALALTLTSGVFQLFENCLCTQLSYAYLYYR